MAGPADTVLILGGTGQIGSELCKIFSDKTVIAPSSSELRIEDSSKVEAAIDEARPGVVINATAFHQLDQCENDPAKSFQVNATAVGAAARICRERNVRFATISTDYVFSGSKERPYTEDDREDPVNVYGISKLAGERYVAALCPSAIVFRVSGVFGKSGYSNKGPTFVERMVTLAEKGEPIRVVDNIRFSPTYAPHVAQTMRNVIESNEAGLMHVTNSGTCTWYELAVEAIRAAGLSANVERTQYSNEASPIKRPLFSALGHARLQSAGFQSPPTWQAAVSEYLSERSHRNEKAKV